MPEIKLIALDLDGTLLNSDKELTKTNEEAIRYASSLGIEIVPTTGRFYSAMPEVIRNLDFVRYVIAINGASVVDLEKGEKIYRAEMTPQLAVSVMEFLDGYPLIYDCYMDDAAFMTAALKEKIDDFAPDIHYNKMLHELRAPVPELKEYIIEKNHGVQKIQFFAKDLSLREKLMEELPERFPELNISSSVVNNVEINHKDADKGKAVTFLANHIGFGAESVMSFGDGLNDLSMIKAAGIGVAMANSNETVKAAADRETESCDEDGVAKEIYRTVGSPGR